MSETRPMSRTLFFYIFKDLLRIFILTSGALAGIMSFGGLLRPLTEHGLDASQAGTILSYFMPAMTTYSLPIAALFATTIVYGRLAADNEVTAMRAAGIGFHSIALPAVMLGFIVALVSLLLLCFIVPVFTLKVERVIYSNLAQLIANQIDRTHQIKFQDITIFAQDAEVASDARAGEDDEQVVSLGGLMIVSYREQPSAVPNTPAVQVPREFYVAKQATVRIRRGESDEFTLQAKLEDPGGAMFPRTFEGQAAVQGGLQATQYGPVPIPSPVQEDVKFMDIRRLHELYRDLSRSRRVQEQVQKLIRSAQEAHYLGAVANAMARPDGVFHFDAGSERYDLISVRGRDGLQARGGRLSISPAKLVQTRDGATIFTWDAAEVLLDAEPVSGGMLSVRAQLHDVVAQTPEGPDARPSFTRTIAVKMPADVKQFETYGLDYFSDASNKFASPTERNTLNRTLIRLGNGIQSELHSRCSFALSCLILVIVGCCLGLMFKSGNYLTAFALSVIPALVCIALIVAGQHTCENIPWKLENFKNPLNLGIALIWSGNAMVLAIAVALGWKLQRQ